MTSLIHLFIFTNLSEIPENNSLFLKSLNSLHSCGKCSWDIIKSPLKWTLKKWLSFALTITAISAFLPLDILIREMIQSYRNNKANKYTDIIAAIVRIPGDIRIILLLFFLYRHSCLINTPPKKRYTYYAIECILQSGFFTGIFKESFHRKRPNMSNNQWIWKGPSISFQNLSFPSGHATISFALATSIVKNTPNQPVVNILCYSLATLTAVSRLYHNFHWASDVAAGSAIGYFTSSAIHYIHHQKSMSINL